ncbi:MAG: DUF4115 domain-containing protein [Chloroflexi bacterium]|nr:DUF4115 domain-containing protein [Chloroflexota bacterium]
MSLLGERLRQAREARGIAPLQVEIDTRIRAAVIEALEQGDWSSLPPEPFLRGLIRTYSMYLKLDPEAMVQLFATDVAPPPPPPPLPPPAPASAKKTVPPAKPAPVIIAEEKLPLAPPSPKPGTSIFSRIDSVSLPPPIPGITAVPPPPPEHITARANGAIAMSHDILDVEPFWLRRWSRLAQSQIPLPLWIVLGIAAVFAIVMCGALVVTQFIPSVALMINPPQTATPTRVLATRTPTLRAGAQPTTVPVINATAPPFATFPGNPSATPTARTTPRRTIEAAPTGLNLDIEATEKILVQVGVDGVLVFNSAMEPGTTRDWSAKESLYVRVENAKGAVITFNRKAQAARNFAERTTMERQWNLNPKGTPVSVQPVAPAAPKPVTIPTPTPIAPPPTFTLTPTA